MSYQLTEAHALALKPALAVEACLKCERGKHVKKVQESFGEGEALPLAGAGNQPGGAAEGPWGPCT